MQSKTALFLFFILFLISCKYDNSKSTILTIFAHPDDETTMGAVLARYAKEQEVYLLFATDGSYGVTDHMGIPPGDSLVKIRQEEAECSCTSLGINPPIFLGLQDGLGLNGHGNFYEQEPLLKTRLLETIQRIQPTTIITFGPDGDTGHPDHRLLGAIVTELLLREGLTEQIDLYYFGWTRDQAEKYSWWDLNYMDASVMDTEIHFDQEDEDKAMNSIRCHRSQYTPEEMELWIKTEEEDPSNVSYFRKFNAGNQKRTRF